MTDKDDSFNRGLLRLRSVKVTDTRSPDEIRKALQIRERHREEARREQLDR